MNIKKVIIPVAGAGTRLLPVTKSQPKEMLPVGRRPIVQYVVEEAEAAGLHQVLFVTGKNKRAIEDYFDKDTELIARLNQSGQDELVEELNALDFNCSFFYVRQNVQAGLADAIAQSKDFVDGQNFVVALGDSTIKSPDPGNLIRRMMKIHKEKQAACVVAVQKVDPAIAHKYGVVSPGAEIEPGVFELTDLVEKPPTGQAPSDLAVCARYVFNSVIFKAISRTTPDCRGELQITDSIRLLLKENKPVYAVKLNETETRYDIGNFETYFKAFVDFALDDEKYGYTLRQHLYRKLQESSS